MRYFWNMVHGSDSHKPGQGRYSETPMNYSRQWFWWTLCKFNINPVLIQKRRLLWRMIIFSESLHWSMLDRFNLILYCEEYQDGMSRQVCFKGTIHHIICNFHVNALPMMITANWCHAYPHFPVQFYVYIHELCP